jgi:hypothetical protein
MQEREMSTILLYYGPDHFSAQCDGIPDNLIVADRIMGENGVNHCDLNPREIFPERNGDPVYMYMMSIEDGKYTEINAYGLALDPEAEAFLRRHFDDHFERTLGRKMTRDEAQSILRDHELFRTRELIGLAQISGSNRCERWCHIALAQAAWRKGYTAAVGRQDGRFVRFIDCTDRADLLHVRSVQLAVIQPT